MKKEWVIIGKIIETHGLGGVVKVVPLTSLEKRFADLHEVMVEDAGGNRTFFHIEGIQYQKDVVLLKFKELESESQARSMVKGTLQILEQDLAPLPEGSYYHFELLGMQVYTEEGKWLGELQDILSTGSNDVYVVQDGKREHLIPATKEVVQEVDVSNQKMKIHVLEGLLEDNEL